MTGDKLRAETVAYADQVQRLVNDLQQALDTPGAYEAQAKRITGDIYTHSYLMMQLFQQRPSRHLRKPPR